MPPDVNAVSDGRNALDEADSFLASKISELNVFFRFTVDKLIEVDSDIAPLEEVLDDEMILRLVTAEECEPEEVIADTRFRDCAYELLQPGEDRRTESKSSYTQ